MLPTLTPSKFFLFSYLHCPNYFCGKLPVISPFRRTINLCNRTES
jgi:hypothetical protein